MKSPYRLLLYLHAFVGIGALFGGLAGMPSSREPLGIPAELKEPVDLNERGDGQGDVSPVLLSTRLTDSPDKYIVSFGKRTGKTSPCLYVGKYRS